MDDDAPDDGDGKDKDAMGQHDLPDGGVAT
jgi:hypothetical protein